MRREPQHADPSRKGPTWYKETRLFCVLGILRVCYRLLFPLSIILLCLIYVAAQVPSVPDLVIQGRRPLQLLLVDDGLVLSELQVRAGVEVALRHDTLLRIRRWRIHEPFNLTLDP